MDSYSKAVELGCGNGRLTNSIAREFEAVEALDVSKERLTRARQNVGLRNIDWRLIEGPPMPIESATAELVISTHVIGHLGDILRRAPKKWVKAVVLPITRALMRAGIERLPWKIDFYRMYDYPWLRGTLEGVGFTEVEVRLLPWAGGHSYAFARRPTVTASPEGASTHRGPYARPSLA